MEKRSFEDYEVEDFIADESFINYHLRLNENDRIFWERWLINNPSKRSVAKEAREIIQSLSLTLDKKEYEDELEKIKIAINKDEPHSLFQFLNRNKNAHTNQRKKRSIRYMIVAFLMLGVATIYLLMQHPENKMAGLNETVNRGNRTMTITLSDSTVVTLAPNSTLQYPSSFEGKNRQVYLQGEAGFNVKRNEHFPFKVHAKNIVTTVLGTIFNIKNQGDSAIAVELLEGKLNVEIEDATVQPILLYPEEKAIYVFHDKHFYKYSNAIKFNLSFSQNSFEEIAIRIKDVFGKTVINNSDKKNWRFTGQFKNTTLDEIIENICLVKNLKSRVVADTIFINNN